MLSEDAHGKLERSTSEAALGESIRQEVHHRNETLIHSLQTNVKGTLCQYGYY